MIRRTLDLVKEEFRAQEAFNDVAKIASFHRVQISPGINDAGRFIQSYLTKAGIQCELLEFPAKKGITWWSQESFQVWKANDAQLVLLEDGKRETLCAFSEIKTSLIQRSAPTPPEGIKTTMVYVENGEDPKSYEDIDVEGKLVFSRGDVARIAKVAVDQFGAAGIVLDNMREFPPVRDRFDLPDARQYQAFWPIDGSTHKARGFMVSPRQGEALRKRFAKQKELSVWAMVDAEFSDGVWEIPTAVIPGESNEEVVAVAHLCHPEHSANDNASGCGALMEAARTLWQLVKTGKLDKPKRSIRFLWVPEMTGSYAFLAANEDKLSNIVAAINLDMVGENQELCGSTFMVERPISALPGFGGDLASAILGLLTKEVGNLAGTGLYSTFRWTVGPYSGGSDHSIWGDPSVGITCPMLIQWPDKYYHTSEDTIDKVDPRMLKVAGVLTATYLYTAATATPGDTAVIAGEAAARFPGEADAQLSVLVDQAKEQLGKANGEAEVSEVLAKARRAIELRAGFLADRKKLDLSSLRRLVPDSPMLSDAMSEAGCLIEEAGRFLLAKALRELAVLAGLADVSGLPPAWQPEEGEAYKRAKSIIPKRVFRGPFSSTGKEVPADYEERVKALREKYGESALPLNRFELWADGKRTLLDIALLIESETGFSNLDAIVDYYDLQVERGVFEG
ncbi:MAG TPA: DUF4910 domain-containing protein [Firmicutes bacterium]|jgi:hypothetical protein|nr:DUF4910 domain-containing protein [Candidatus Fermentithermobacillaceae bacterium]